VSQVDGICPRFNPVALMVIDKAEGSIPQGGRRMSSRTHYLVWLIGLALFDIFIPVPLTAGLMIYVVLRRPLWFREIVREIYDKENLLKSTGGSPSGAGGLSGLTKEGLEKRIAEPDGLDWFREHEKEIDRLHTEGKIK